MKAREGEVVKQNQGLWTLFEKAKLEYQLDIIK